MSLLAVLGFGSSDRSVRACEIVQVDGAWVSFGGR